MPPQFTTPLTKQCTRCGQTKPFDAFFRDSHLKSGRMSACKECVAIGGAERLRKWRQNNLEKARATDKAYRQAHPEIINGAKDRYKAKYPNKAKEATKSYRIRNPDKIKAYQKKYVQENRSKVYALKSARRARFLGADGSFTSDDVERQIQGQKNRCYWCHNPLETRYHVDHIIPLTRGGTNWPSNLVIACIHCNTSKSNKLPHEWPEGGHLC